jgi:hypothetical protein
LSLVLVVTFLSSLAAVQPASAQSTACEKYPSSQCPAQGVARGLPNYPCFAQQIKADWNTGLYRLPGQASYAASGYEINADTWCFDSDLQAQQQGFRPAAR